MFDKILEPDEFGQGSTPQTSPDFGDEDPFRGFLSHRGTPKSSIYRWDFLNHPAIGVPSFEEPSI
jgi:hypothetical protein